MALGKVMALILVFSAVALSATTEDKEALSNSGKLYEHKNFQISCQSGFGGVIPHHQALR